MPLQWTPSWLKGTSWAKRVSPSEFPFYRTQTMSRQTVEWRRRRVRTGCLRFNAFLAIVPLHGGQKLFQYACRHPNTERKEKKWEGIRKIRIITIKKTVKKKEGIRKIRIIIQIPECGNHCSYLPLSLARLRSPRRLCPYASDHPLLLLLSLPAEVRPI
jgi:hypothetical protein